MKASRDTEYTILWTNKIVSLMNLIQKCRLG